jgi:hypothetical protein
MDIIVLECRWFDGMVLPHYCTVHSNLLLLSSNPGINMGKCTYISAHWHSFILYYYWFDRLAFEYVVQFESYKVLEKNTLQIIVHVLFNPINIPVILKYLNVCIFFSSDSCVYGWHLLVVLLSPNLDGSRGVDVADGSEALEQMVPSSPIKWSKDGKKPSLASTSPPVWDLHILLLCMLQISAWVPPFSGLCFSFILRVCESRVSICACMSQLVIVEYNLSFLKSLVILF